MHCFACMHGFKYLNNKQINKNQRLIFKFALICGNQTRLFDLFTQNNELGVTINMCCMYKKKM